MQFHLENEKPKPTKKYAGEPGLAQGQSSEEIDKELYEKLSSLGINLTSSAASPSTRATNALPAALDEKRTAVLDIGELRNALRQQIGIAEIKREVEKIIRGILETGPADEGQTQELELRASALLLPYCKEYIPDFPREVRPSEFAIDLNLQDIIDFHAEASTLSQEEVEETVEQYAVQIIQTLLSHPLIPQKAAKRIGVDLKTTALKDERGTALYSSSDAHFLQILFNEQKLLERGGEVGLLAILISGKKWNKIDSDMLFNTAVLFTLEAMAKKRGIPSIVLRGQGEDHPIAYILGEYIAHNLDQALEGLINFVESFLQVSLDALNATAEGFLSAIYQNYLPQLKVIFHDRLHESFDRFIEIFRREFQQSQQTLRNKIFFLKRIGDLCEVSFYCYEAICVLESASGEVYAKEKLDEGTKHFAFRNNIPIDETSDFLSQKNTLSEILLYTLKQRTTVRESGSAQAHFASKLMNDLLFFLDSLRKVFDHSYARGRATSASDYNGWEEMVADCSQGYSRLFFGRSLNDIERYHFENIYKRLVEHHLSFFDLQTPMLFQSTDFKLEKFAKAKSPEDNLKEHFLKFFIALHQALLNFTPEQSIETSAPTRGLETAPSLSHAARPNTAAFTMEAVKARAFLSQSDLSLSEYTLEALSATITPDARDKVILLQALRSAVDLAGKAHTAEEIHSMNLFLQNLRQRVSLLYVLNDQEKEQWRNSILASLKELEQNDPIAISSYGLVLGSIDDWDISQERIMEEWKNPETSILRMQQLFFILLLTRPIETLHNLIDNYQRWLSKTELPADSARKKAHEKRLELLRRYRQRGRLQLALLRFLLLTMQYVQLSYEITIWDQPPAYLLEDLLAVETPLKRVREIMTVLSTKHPEEVRQIVKKFTSVLNERFQQSASGYSYYTDEEKRLLEKRRHQFDALGQRAAWQAKRDRLIFTLSRLLLRPIKGTSVTNQK
ncbi:MAG: hypothetical protein AB1489_16030 [Acidobacteriota bacterium]